MTSTARQMMPLDHLVMPVTDIATARSRLSQLGFTVAADARHPFGTENSCVFFADKSYLEPLGVGSPEDCARAEAEGNQFVARNSAFRFRRGPEGLSAIVLGSADADGDDARFKAGRMSGGDMLQFSRPMKLPDGSEITATFKLTFAADLRAPDFHVITCQRINVVPVDRSALEAHANGVTAIRHVVLSEPDPEDFRAFLTESTGSADVSVTDAGMDIATANATISVLNPDAMMAAFGINASCHSRGLRGRAIVFAVRDIAATEALFKANGVDFIWREGRILVPHEDGQSVMFAFEE